MTRRNQNSGQRADASEVLAEVLTIIEDSAETQDSAQDAQDSAEYVLTLPESVTDAMSAHVRAVSALETYARTVTHCADDATPDYGLAARIMLESVPENDKFRALFSESREMRAPDATRPDFQTECIVLYFAGFEFLIYSESGKYFRTSVDLRTYDSAGRQKTVTRSQRESQDSEKNAIRAASIAARSAGISLLAERRKTYAASKLTDAEIATLKQDAASAKTAQSELEAARAEIAALKAAQSGTQSA